MKCEVVHSVTEGLDEVRGRPRASAATPIMAAKPIQNKKIPIAIELGKLGVHAVKRATPAQDDVTRGRNGNCSGVRELR